MKDMATRPGTKKRAAIKFWITLILFSTAFGLCFWGSMIFGASR